MRSIRREMQIVLQDPYLSLDPRLRVGDIVKEPLLPLGRREMIRWMRYLAW